MARIGKKAGTYHHGDLRRALLDAAVKVVEKDGVSALTLQTLARRAGVSSGAPYHHFESREQLLAAIAQDGLLLLVQEMKRASADASDAGEYLAGLGRGYVRFALAHRGHFRVIFRPELREQLGPGLNEALGEGMRLLKDAILRCQAEGFAPVGDPMPLVLLAWSAVHGACDLWVDGSLSEEHLVADGEALGVTITSALTQLLSGTARSNTRRAS